jgi:hypothetical protein
MTWSPLTPIEAAGLGSWRERRTGPAYLRGLPASVWRNALNLRHRDITARS